MVMSKLIKPRHLRNRLAYMFTKPAEKKTPVKHKPTKKKKASKVKKTKKRVTKKKKKRR